MRSAGCIFNDIVDKDFDKKVERTKQRPITSGKVSVKLALLYTSILCLAAFLILIQFNIFTIFLGMFSMLLAFSYPFMKRITYWPQLFLGLTFNWGIIMAWTAMNLDISFEIILLYVAAIFWTLGYDTIYGAQDMSDDEIIGLKSTSIKFKKDLKIFITSCYLISSIIIIFLFRENINFNLLTIFLSLIFLSFFYQIFKFKTEDAKTCLEAFKFNNISGFLLSLTIYFINI